MTGSETVKDWTTQVAPPPTHLVWAILSLLFFWPLAIVAIVFATQVRPKWARGDIAGARAASANAKKFAIWSPIVWVIALGLLVLVRLLLALSTQFVT